MLGVMGLNQTRSQTCSASIGFKSCEIPIFHQDTVQDAMEVESMGEDEDPGDLTLEKTFSNESLEMSPGNKSRVGWMRNIMNMSMSMPISSYIYI